MAERTHLLVQPDETNLLLLDDEESAVTFYEQTLVISTDHTTIVGTGSYGPVGPQGPQGPQGEPGLPGASFNYVTAIAGQAVSAGRLVTMTGANSVTYFDATNVAHYGKAVGVTMHAASNGAQVKIGVVGPVDLVGIGYVTGTRFWAGPNGTLVSTPPATGMVIPVGYAVDSNTLHVQLGSYLVF